MSRVASREPATCTTTPSTGTASTSHPLPKLFLATEAFSFDTRFEFLSARQGPDPVIRSACRAGTSGTSARSNARFPSPERALQLSRRQSAHADFQSAPIHSTHARRDYAGSSPSDSRVPRDGGTRERSQLSERAAAHWDRTAEALCRESSRQLCPTAADTRSISPAHRSAFPP